MHTFYSLFKKIRNISICNDAYIIHNSFQVNRIRKNISIIELNQRKQIKHMSISESMSPLLCGMNHNPICRMMRENSLTAH
jgi:hypothetical protein